MRKRGRSVGGLVAASCDIFALYVNTEDYFKSQGRGTRGARHPPWSPHARCLRVVVSGFLKRHPLYNVSQKTKTYTHVYIKIIIKYIIIIYAI